MAFSPDRALPYRSEPNALLLLPALTLAAAVVFALAMVMNPLLSLQALIFCSVIAAVFVKPRYGLHVAVAAAMLADFHLGDPSVTDGARLFQSLAQYGVLISPVELVLLSASLGLGVRLLFDEETDFTPGELMLPLAMFLLTISLGVGIGLARGADMVALRTETRGLYALPAVYLLATHFIRDRQQLWTLLWVFIISVNIMSIESTYRYFTYIRDGYNLNVHPDLAFGHENALFCAAAIVLLIGRLVWSKNIWGEWRSLALIMLPIIAILVMRRRAGMVALDAGLILLCVVLLKDNFRQFLIAVPIAALGAGALLALTWNQPGGSGQFARSFQTVTDTGTQTSRDESSDDYRENEGTNVRLNIQSQPITGLGFGKPYAHYIPVADLRGFWPMWQYIPHNSVMWIWMKGGVLAFIAMLALLGTAMFRSMQLMQVMKNDSMKPVAFGLCAMIMMFTMFAYVDLGFASGRALIFFGMALGCIGGLARVMQSHPDDESAAA